jgi:tetratricopeptide (TPR) repeat protein
MNMNWLILLLLSGLGSEAAGQGSEFVTGRAYYAAGEFKKAAAHFQLALKVKPNDAESYYWMGMSYQALSDIAWPLGHTYHSKARVCLTKAAELAPSRPDYRRELFDFLLESPGSSRAALPQAAEILRMVPESDPDHPYMRLQFEQAKSLDASADARLGRLFLAVPGAAYRIAELPCPHRRAGPKEGLLTPIQR